MRKKLFAVIMSAMMMITFMPSMAFAAVTYNAESVTNWNDYSKATVKFVNSADDTDTYTQDIATIRLAGATFNGTITAKVKGHDSLTDSYVDLDSAKVSEISGCAVGGGTLTLAEAQAMFGPKFDKTVNVTELTYSVPTYVNDYNTANSTLGEGYVNGDQTATADATSLTGMSFKLAAPAYDFDKMYTEDQTFELAVIPTFQTTAKFVGMLPSVKLTIKKTKADVNNLVADSYTFKDKFNMFYDGAEHTLEQAAMTGVTSTYELYNTKTGKYEAIDAVKAKNVGTYNLKATAKDTNGKSKMNPKSFEVKKSCGVEVQFKAQAAGSAFKVADTVEPEKYLVVNAVAATNTPNATSDAAKSAKKAIAADKKAILEYVAEMYTITVNEDMEATIALNNELTYAETEAIKTKYAELLNNYEEIDLGTNVTAQFKVIDDITFTKAPLTKTYKAKKGKLPKAKKFQVKAKAASGATLVYKVKSGAGKIVINRTTGKVTVKKGLKKGTYKVTVKAITLDSFGKGDEEISDSYTLKIKVK